MEIEDRLKAIEDELPGVKGELKRILLDLRAFVMEVCSPIRGDSSKGNIRSRILLEKRVEADGDREES
jgi:hypothetical protein